MKIALLTLGTRGDVQPFAVLGKSLKQRGHQITISSAANFDSFIKSYDLNFIPVDADFQEILNSEEGKKMMSNPFSARKHLNRLIYPMMIDAMNKFHSISKENDIVLFHVKAMADYYADGLKTKLIRTNVVPAIQPTREFVNPIVSSLNLPAFLNRFSYKLSDLGMKMMSRPINNFRSSAGITGKYKKRNLPSIYGLSSYFIPQPKDYPANCRFTGFWFDNSQQELEIDVLNFINNGEPPLLFTFGSMPFKSNIDLVKVFERITKELHTRLIVVKGWGLSNTEELEQNKNIKVISTAPYDKLMPHIKAAVHHGGIGTSSECMRAGKPFLTCPVLYPLGDQHFWGTIAYKKGIGLKPLPLKRITEDEMINSVKELINNKELHANSRNMMENLRNEDGVKNAIELIEDLKF
jgi:sterol 3beta-glucosyltransferase